MNPLNQILRETFHFSSRDLLANRAGKLSERQKARQSAAGTSLKVGIAFFVVVMLGSLGLFFFFSSATGANEGASDFDTMVGTGAVIGVTLLILIISLFASQKHLAATKEKQIQKAEGEMSHGKIREDSANFEIKIGRTKIRLITQGQLEAFQVGERYRVHFLPGFMPTILSAEVLGTEAEADQYIEPADSIEDDEIIQRQKRARPIVVVLAVLTFAFPLAMFTTSVLSESLRCVVWLALLGVGFGFAAWALRRMGEK
jgi:protein-S-isoprenylcysteine O-methyltransferase Ste14